MGTSRRQRGSAVDGCRAWAIPVAPASRGASTARNGAIHAAVSAVFDGAGVVNSEMATKAWETAMSELQNETVDEAARQQAATGFIRADLACAFGPSFFLGHLGRFVRDRCPDVTESLPLVQVRLADGETLDICHIIGVSPRWVMLAVRDTASHRDGMAVELVPYEIIRRVGIATRHGEGSSIGFAQTTPPEIIAPEMLLRAAMTPHANSAG